MERVFSSRPDSSNEKLKRDQQSITIETRSTHLLTLFDKVYFSHVHLFGQVSTTEVTSESFNCVQRLMVLLENVPKCWLSEISSYFSLPENYCWLSHNALGKEILFTFITDENTSIRLVGTPKGHILSSLSQNRWSIPPFNQ